MATLSNNAIIKLDGVTLRCKPGASVDTGGTTSEEMVDAAGNVDFMETRVAGGAEAVIHADADTDIAFLKAFRGTATVEFLDSGKVFTIGGARITNNLVISGGELPITIRGREAIPQ